MLALAPHILCALLAPQTGPIHPGGTWETYYNFSGNRKTFGRSIANIGDIDKDGYGEIAISAPGFSAGTSASGNIFVFSAKTGDLLYSTISMSGYIGSTIIPMGDIDADGFPDFMVNAPFYHVADLGLVRLYSGRDGSIIRDHVGTGGFYSSWIANLQDLNGDGIAEYAVSAILEYNPPSHYGAVYVYDGKTGAQKYKLTSPSSWRNIFGTFVASLGDYDLDGVPDIGVAHTVTNILIYSGRTGQYLTSLSDSEWSLHNEFINAGDVDGDGFDDLAIGSLNHPATQGIRARFRIYSVVTGETLLSTIAPRQEKLWFGTGPTKVGDINRDGVQDFMFGNITDSHNWTVDPEIGAAYIFSGLDGEILGRFEGTRAYDWYGFDCATMGDLNNDGIPEVAVSGPFAEFGDGLVQIWSLKPFLSANRYKLSAQLGGTVDFEIDFPQTEAKESFAILASTERLGSFDLYGLEVPIPETWLTRFMLSGGRPTGFLNAKGPLDSRGDALATYTAAPGTLLPLLGKYLSLTAVSFSPPMDTREASVPIWIYVHP